MSVGAGCCRMRDGRKAVAFGLCHAHYKQKLRGRRLSPLGSTIAQRGFASMPPAQVRELAARAGRQSKKQEER